jgi:TolA-binding protein
MKRVVISVVMVAVGAAAVPAQAQNREHLQMAADLRILQEQQQEQAQQIEKLAKGLSETGDAIKALATRLDASDAATRKALADQKSIIDNLNTQMRAINDRASDTNVRIGTLSEDLRALTTSLSSAITSINAVAAALSASASASSAAPPPADSSTSAGGTPPPVAVAPPPPAPSIPRASAPGVSPSLLYNTAWGDYTAGDAKNAATGFETFLREHPTSERAADAQFYLAESNVKLKKLPEAVAGFTAVIQNYPTKVDSVAHAYYRLGEVQRSQGQIEAARTAWETLVTKYPDSDWGILAKQRLDGLPPPAAPRP